PRRRPVRPRPGGGVLHRLLSHHPRLQLCLLHGDEPRGRPVMTKRRPSPVLIIYLIISFVPIYWLLNMALKSNEEILGGFTLYPQHPTLDNFKVIFTDRDWSDGYLHSITYVTINTLLSVFVALPAAYAFSRYRFMGDKHLFFWLLTNRMSPPAVFLLPFF